MHGVRALLLLWALCGSMVSLAQVAVPPLSARITDLTATLTAEQVASLEQTLSAFEAKKGSQFAVLIVPTTEPETVEEYALRVAEQWRLGRKGIDDGAILVVAKNDRALRIEVGYGLEGALNDATSKRIISESITPRFVQGDFYGGIADGMNQMMRVVDGEPLPEPVRGARGNTASIEQYLPIIFIMSLVVGGMLRTIFGRFPGALVTGGVIAVVTWLFIGVIGIALVAGVMALFFTLMGGVAGRRGIGGALGGLGGGGFGGGGFGGGGGGFGGGGASGRW